ncbi:MAG: response regulator [Candidatus Eisenbacteria bacterium]|uniref:histidine kinase n=1 Tax=Eiseniibacteriota bacterium TaxID=2212470 RepID=A0A948RVG3_UNCEI|nr:response regulator [Candidatus Eisenbacteria bacterium]
MEDVEEDSRTRICLNHIFEAGQRAGELVDQILTFSRQAAHERSALSIQSILKEVLKLLRATFPATIQIHQQIDPQCHPILGDPAQIHQVIMNLCTNALHAMIENGGQLSISLENIFGGSAVENPVGGAEKDRWVKLTVSDTGVGMDPNVQERVFDPFYTTKKVNVGAGMGLATVHGIVESMGGKIRLDSAPGKGTTFTILFPSIIKEVKRPGSPTDAKSLKGIEHILLLDDEEVITELGRISLEGAGYAVSCFTSPLNALKHFKADPDQFDLIISDVTMPEMTGPEIARAVLKIRPNMPIILFTGYSEVFDEGQAKEIGISRYLKKPITRSLFLKEIQEVLHKTNVREA